jgi:hypothetical protein
MRGIQYVAVSPFITDVSGILDRPPSRAMTAESVACVETVIASANEAIHIAAK